MGEWAPSPARLFQALVAAAARGATLDEDAREALVWLEGRHPPIVAVPQMCVLQRIAVFGPDNDLDAVGNDPIRVGEIRSPKTTQPKLFDPNAAFLYGWEMADADDSEDHAQTVCRIADRVYQFGRGVDMAWASGEVISREELDALLWRHRGPVYRPAPGSAGRALACPAPGSLASLSIRYAKGRERFRVASAEEPGKQLFSQPPKPRFTQVAYESPPRRRVFALRPGASHTAFFAYAQARACELVVWIRDEAARRLRETLPARHAEIERVLIGRKVDGADDGPTFERVRIVPLPSIGHEHVDRGIRRVLVEVPSGCPLRAEDVWWAISGLELVSAGTGEVHFVITPFDSDRILLRYLEPSHSWRTVTPAALPEFARRRRIDPARRAEEAKSGEERIEEQRRTAGAVVHALRHADVRIRAEVIRVQREPFDRNGTRVEGFAEGTRFAKERLWHVEITFGSAISGPLVIGDGRFLGLGVMAPVAKTHGIHAFAVESGFAGTPNPSDVARALRRAVMARVQKVLGDKPMPTFFSGHEPDGSPARSDSSSHAAFAFHPISSRLLVVAPHVLDRREPSSEENRHLTVLEEALVDLRELRAGPAGRLALRSEWIDVDTDALTAPSRTWESVTPYLLTHHAKRVDAAEALCLDVLADCRRRGLPVPAVTPLETQGVPGLGLLGRARLVFAVAVRGPILLGRSRYTGGGLFSATDRGRRS
jgi:CRISPR-associated protein Csb2